MAANGYRLRPKRKKLTTFDIIVFTVLTLLFIILVVPFWSIIVTSFSTNESYIRQPFSLWPGEFTLANYLSVFARGSGLLVAYKNTIIISVIGTFVGNRLDPSVLRKLFGGFLVFSGAYSLFGSKKSNRGTKNAKKALF